MTELRRRRSARDLWISRGHLWAAGTAAGLLAVIAFSLGVVVGGGEPAHASAEPVRLPDVPDDSLVELLARVEASADPSGGVSELTFPDVLAGGPRTARVPEGAQVTSGPAVVTPAPGSSGPQVDARPSGSWTVLVLATPSEDRARALRDQLQARELEAWLGLVQVAGHPEWRVAVGGYSSESQAEAAVADLQRSGLPLLAHSRVDRIP